MLLGNNNRIIGLTISIAGNRREVRHALKSSGVTTSIDNVNIGCGNLLRLYRGHRGCIGDARCLKTSWEMLF